MAVHDSRDWTGERAGNCRALRNLLHQLQLVDSSDKTFEQSPFDTYPIAFYAERGFFKEDKAIEAVAQKLSLDIFKLSEHSLESLSRLLDSVPTNSFSPSAWKEMRAIPIAVAPGEITVAMADPLDRAAYSRMQFAFDRPVEVVLGKEAEILKVLSKNLAQEDNHTVELIVRGKQEEEAPHKKEVFKSNAADFESSIGDDDPNAAPVVRLVNKFFSRAIAAGASDLHLTPTKSGLQVKARIDGIMQPLLEVPEGLKDNVLSRVKLLCGMDISERRRPQDGRLRINTNFGVKDLRISSVPSAHGENIVARILSSDVKATTFDELGVPEELRKQIERNLKRSCKVNLVTGPTGSGKTSTLYASLLHLHDKSRNIITLEDPIEYRIDGITQIQVNNKIDFTFAAGLRSILRQDPDVVLVGEIRDEETASISMKTAQTGHLVLSTLHTNSAAAAVTRLLDLDIPGYLIASSLGSVLAQRLVRKLCPDCAKKVAKKKREELGLGDKVREAVGCEKCRESGYAGRVGVFSFLEVTESVAEAIRLELGEEEIERRAKETGFCSLAEAGLELVRQGVTSYEEVERVIGLVEGVESSTSEVVVASAKSAEKANEPKGLFTQPKVLLVEDDEDQRAIYGSIFESEMFQVLTAIDGRDALEKLMTETVDVVVCDVMMPRIDGHDFIRRIRANHQTRDLPILMLTAANTEESELESITSGADDFLSKTSSVNVLLARLRRLVERSSEEVTHQPVT
ncbi:MAG: Flp pilus assembly complex ATPase component TadA [Bdellovibrionales bacterium]|nr:Flp pilus assembly complex ATPase component TadA [Bdellovibrionales bacterium]